MKYLLNFEEKTNESILDIFKKDSKLAYDWLIKNNGLGKSVDWLIKNKNTKIVQLFVKKYFSSKETTNNWNDLSKMDKQFVDFIINQLRAKIEGVLKATPGDVENVKSESGKTYNFDEAETKLKEVFSNILA